VLVGVEPATVAEFDLDHPREVLDESGANVQQRRPLGRVGLDRPPGDALLRRHEGIVAPALL
jgi:hypothetical protein